MAPAPRFGPLIVMSGPSGSGKSTLVREVLGDGRYPLRLAVSATTRPPRQGERSGVDYYFWDREQFQRGLEAGEFLESAVVHGQHYGTPRSEVLGHREQGVGVILDIDVQGYELVRNQFPDHVSIFVALSSWEMYEQRIRKRASETEETIARRLATARRELERISEYQHVIINDELAPAVRRFYDVVGPHFEQGSK